ncbi:heavy metal-binding domain-containing protein [Erwinia sp. CPCC 100877]|nr:heavy metal-binding domain-containing protein [Erwinia sp. CPCC 100877]
MKIVTTETLADAQIVKTKGAIFSEQVISINIVKDAISGIKGLFGGKSMTYSKEYKDARKKALNELTEQAEQLQANALISLNVDYNQMINSDVMLIIVTANATAVTIA